MLTDKMPYDLLTIEHGPDCAESEMQMCGHDSCSGTWGGVHQAWLDNWKAQVPELKAYLVSVNQYTFPDAGPMIELTCSNHPEGRWLTKGWARSLHWIGWFEPVDLTDPEYSSRQRLVTGHPEFGYFNECPCKWADLQVIVTE
jgi:hypothetical protein